MTRKQPSPPLATCNRCKRRVMHDGADATYYDGGKCPHCGHMLRYHAHEFSTIGESIVHMGCAGIMVVIIMFIGFIMLGALVGV